MERPFSELLKCAECQDALETVAGSWTLRCFHTLCNGCCKTKLYECASSGVLCPSCHTLTTVVDVTGTSEKNAPPPAPELLVKVFQMGVEDVFPEQLLREAAAEGDLLALRLLGRCLEKGIGVAKDEKSAAQWYLLAAQQGDAIAQHRLGRAFDEGIGMEQNDTGAVRWYRRAAKQGLAAAQCSLGFYYVQVEEDERQAVKLFRRAAEQGDAVGQFNLGLCYDEGVGVEKNEGQAVKWYRLAAKQGDPDAQNNLLLCYVRGERLLSVSGGAGDVLELRSLLKVGIYADVQDVVGRTPLFRAVESGHADACAVLLEFHADANIATNEDQCTPLHVAATRGNTRICKLLLEHGAGIEVADVRGATPLEQAISNGHTETCKLLLAHGAKADPETSRDPLGPLGVAGRHGDEELCRLLLKHGARVDGTGKLPWERTPLCCVAMLGHTHICKIFLDSRANVNATDVSGMPPLGIAAEGGHEKTCELLLDYGANVNAGRNSYHGCPLLMAATQGHVEICRLLLDRHADVNLMGTSKEGASALHKAALHCRLEILDILLSAHANTEVVDHYGRTPLLLSVAETDSGSRGLRGGDERQRMTLQILVENGADINARDKRGWSALMIAAWNGHGDVCTVLLANGADGRIVGRRGENALANAVERGHPKICAMLVKSGVDPRPAVPLLRAVRGPPSARVRTARAIGRLLWQGVSNATLYWRCVWFLHQHAPFYAGEVVRDILPDHLQEQDFCHTLWGGDSEEGERENGIC